MTANRKWKRKVRAHAARTGQSYTAALRFLRSSEEAHMRSYTTTTAGLTDIGTVRTSNEDHLLSDGDLFVVADGMGGTGRGELASRLAAETVRAEFGHNRTADALVNAVRTANRAVRDLGAGPDGSMGSDRPFGTTIAAVAMVSERDREEVVSVNVGDSRVYLRRDGRLQLLSRDHSVVGDLVRAGSIEEADAVDHPERHILTQAIGTAEAVTPHVEVVRPASGDRLLLCSDGLFNDLPVAEINRLLDIGDPDEAAGGLISAAVAAGGRDNITALVVDIRAI
ncbi:MAG: protein phosphatase 2C domain-containing protein [Actinomycetota bacterium]